MRSMSGATSRLYKHLRLSGLSSTDSNVVTSIVNRWLKQSGPEWTIDRLKSMKQYIINREANSFAPPPNWVGVHPDGSFKGPFRVIRGLPLVNQLSVLNAYTCIRFPKMTDNQRVKALDAIGTVVDTSVCVALFEDLLTPSFFEREEIKDLRKASASWVLTKEFFGETFPLKPSGLISANPLTFWGRSWIGSFMHGVSQPLVGGYLHSRFGVPLPMESPEDDEFRDSPGEITCIQERGGKARVIAMPNAALQTALRPLHDLLSMITKRLSTDCTFDQEAGAIFAMDSLKNGRTVHSVDLSSATDRFPLSIQLVVLRMLGLEEEAHMFEHVCRSSWYISPKAFNIEGEHSYIKYGTGQPMGLYGSFSLFALTHNLLLTALCERCQVDPQDSFRVLGDDVIIANDAVADSYQYFLRLAKVPVSPSKTIVSETVAEFAGYIITQDGYVKPPKVVSNDMTNFESHIRTFGADVIKELPSRLRAQARRFVEAPEFYGGLGINPQGKPLIDRIPLEVFRDKEINVPTYSSFFPQLLEMREMVEGSEYEDIVTFLYDQYKEYYDLHEITGPLSGLIRQNPNAIELRVHAELFSGLCSTQYVIPLQRFNTFKDVRLCGDHYARPFQLTLPKDRTVHEWMGFTGDRESIINLSSQCSQSLDLDYHRVIEANYNKHKEPESTHVQAQDMDPGF